MKKIALLFLILSSLLLFTNCTKTTTLQSNNKNPPIQTQNNTNTLDSIPEYTEKPEETDQKIDTDLPKDTEESPQETEKPITPDTPNRNVLNFKNMKAMWLSQFDFFSIYTNNDSQRNETDFRNKIKTVLKNVKESGCNTIIVQLRPYADSFYPSEYYPPSRYVTGNYSNNFSYDPIKIIVDEAHKINLSVHGWFNPLRAMTPSEIKSVNDKYQIKQWYNDTQKNGSYLVEYNNRYYLNPAYEDVRGLIINGVKEIITKYNIDGVHMDDYFYPTTSESFDMSAYNDYKSNGGTMTLREFRFNCLNKLVSGIYSTVKSVDTRLLYGISPEGIITNSIDNAFADIYTWCSNDGYIDYICPQVYFGFEHQAFPFDKACEKWEDVVKNKNVKLIIGLTLGKAQEKYDKWAGSGAYEWKNNTDILKRCLEYTKNLDKCTGVAFFCYQYYYSPDTFADVIETRAERDNFIPVLKEISWN
ncbi:MAG: hypothetical protein E7574_01795 [Ruminococcaceae bacterium]|nr:hypothetical protein [Oscillospiraceae bacterium]